MSSCACVFDVHYINEKFLAFLEGSGVRDKIEIVELSTCVSQGGYIYKRCPTAFSLLKTHTAHTCLCYVKFLTQMFEYYADMITHYLEKHDRVRITSITINTEEQEDIVFYQCALHIILPKFYFPTFESIKVPPLGSVRFSKS